MIELDLREQDRQLITGLNDWHPLVLRNHLYYRHRRRRLAKWLFVGIIIGVLLAPPLQVWHELRSMRRRLG